MGVWRIWRWPHFVVVVSVASVGHSQSEACVGVRADYGGPANPEQKEVKSR